MSVTLTCASLRSDFRCSVETSTLSFESCLKFSCENRRTSLGIKCGAHVPVRKSTSFTFFLFLLFFLLLLSMWNIPIVITWFLKNKRPNCNMNLKFCSRNSIFGKLWLIFSSVHCHTAMQQCMIPYNEQRQCRYTYLLPKLCDEPQIAEQHESKHFYVLS